MEDFQRREDEASQQNKKIGFMFALLVVACGLGYQVLLQKVGTPKSDGAVKVEGVEQDKVGRTALHKAAEGGVDKVRGLFPEMIKAINITDKYNETPLVKATRKGLHTTVQLLLDHGADPNVISVEHKTALFHAIFSEKGNATALVLLEGGADVNVSLQHDQSLLHHAVKQGDSNAVATLLKYQVEVSRVESSMGRTALHLAAALKDSTTSMEITAMLLDANAPMNAKDHENGSTALHEAVSAGHAAVVRLLLERGADASIEDDMLRRTPLVLAQKKKKEELVKVFEEVAQKT